MPVHNFRFVLACRDLLAPPDTSRVLAAMLSTDKRQVPLLLMDGLGHTPMEEDPERYLELVEKYM